MERRPINMLIVNDSDLNCDCSEVTLENMTIINLGFMPADIERFELIIYEGKRGSKILRSKYTSHGIIKP